MTEKFIEVLHEHQRNVLLQIGRFVCPNRRVLSVSLAVPFLDTRWHHHYVSSAHCEILNQLAMSRDSYCIRIVWSFSPALRTVAGKLPEEKRLDQRVERKRECPSCYNMGLPGEWVCVLIRTVGWCLCQFGGSSSRKACDAVPWLPDSAADSLRHRREYWGLRVWIARERG